MKRRTLKEALPNECAELFNYGPPFTIRSIRPHSGPTVSPGTHSAPLFRPFTGGGIALADSRLREKTYICIYVHHKTPLGLTTSLGRLIKSLNGDSKVFVSTFNITTSSNDLFFTLCLKNTIINKHLSILSKI